MTSGGLAHDDKIVQCASLESYHVDVLRFEVEAAGQVDRAQYVRVAVELERVNGQVAQVEVGQGRHPQDG